MRRLLWLAMLLGASLAPAQTSIPCGAAGNCGNQVLHASNGSTSNNRNIWYGNALSMTAANLSVSNWYISLKSGVPSFDYVLLLVCDNNLAGTTIAAGGNCPANNVICNSGVKLNPAFPADNTYAASGCTNPLLTTVRYWVFMNNDTSSTAVYQTDAGGSHQTSYFIAAACCTVPASITGTLTATGGEFGVLGLVLSQTSPTFPARRVVTF